MISANQLLFFWRLIGSYSSVFISFDRKTNTILQGSLCYLLILTAINSFA
jgi:hypothetical protein